MRYLGVPFTLLLLIVCGLSCDSKNSPSSTEVANKARNNARESAASNSEPNQPGRAELSNEPNSRNQWVWIELWEEIADELSVPREAIGNTGKIIEEVLDFALANCEESEPTAETLQEYRLALRNFVPTQYQYLPQSPNLMPREGSQYWLAFCIAEASVRACNVTDYGNPPNPDYDQIIREIVDKIIRPCFIEILTEEDYQRWSGKIEKGILEFEANMHTCIFRFQTDPLCPAFRKPEMRPSTMEAIREWFEIENYKRMPKYEEPLEMMVSKDKRYESDLRSFFNGRAVEACLFQLFFREIEPVVRKNRYWGNMKWLAESLSTSDNRGALPNWPVRVRMRPNDTLNKIEKWNRDLD